MFNKPKEIQITPDDCDNNLLVVSDSFKIDQKLRHVFMCKYINHLPYVYEECLT